MHLTTPLTLEYDLRTIMILYTLLVVVPETATSPLPSGGQGAGVFRSWNCSVICDSTNLHDYLPQECTRLCPNYKEVTNPKPQDNARLQTLESKVKSLQVTVDSLLVVTVLLFCVVLVGIPLLVYRHKIKSSLVPACCSSYNTKSKKKRNNSSKKSRPSGGGSPIDKPSRRQPLQEEPATATAAPATVIANDVAVNTQAKESQLARAPPDPPPPDVSVISNLRLRHPSESSCTADVGADSTIDCDPNSSYDQGSSHAYYNYGCSTSTLAVSPTQSRVSYGSEATPLSAGALISQSKVGSTLASPPAQIKYNSALPEGNEQSSFSRGRIRMSNIEDRSNRRPSSPESPSDATVMSNATMDTTLSCGTFSSNI
ncbi:uncharacterized protein LOC108674592 [Hyalella azteca]|uniref:Uncharacterized protein LOC108674592 n=1 Tax=Hyalella azteca TaxID=294128 RepID=A0A8B7NW85_HYAAZ|nr:uncharacterized protein LOC108674592 [Hyalella azteca]